MDLDRIYNTSWYLLTFFPPALITPVPVQKHDAVTNQVPYNNDINQMMSSTWYLADIVVRVCLKKSTARPFLYALKALQISGGKLQTDCQAFIQTRLS